MHRRAKETKPSHQKRTSYFRYCVGPSLIYLPPFASSAAAAFRDPFARSATARSESYSRTKARRKRRESHSSRGRASLYLNSVGEQIFSPMIWSHQTATLLLLCYLHCGLAALLLVGFANVVVMTALLLHHVIVHSSCNSLSFLPAYMWMKFAGIFGNVLFPSGSGANGDKAENVA